MHTGEIKTHHRGYLGAQTPIMSAPSKAQAESISRLLLTLTAKELLGSFMIVKAPLQPPICLITGCFHFLKNMASPCLGYLLTAELNIAVPENIMNTNCTWRWKISITPEQKQNLLKPMAFVKGATEPFRMSSMLQPSETRSTIHFRSFRMIWTSGWRSITPSELTPANIASAEHRCKHFWKPYLQPKKKCCKIILLQHKILIRFPRITKNKILNCRIKYQLEHIKCLLTSQSPKYNIGDCPACYFFSLLLLVCI